MRIETYLWPTFLASALINGDNSSLSDEDEKVLKLALESVKGGRVIDCSDSTEFVHKTDLWPTFNLSCDASTFTVLFD